MSEMEPKRRTPAREMFTGMLLVFVVGAAIVLAGWAMRLRERERALRGPVAPAMRGEIQPPTPRAAGTKPPWDESTLRNIQGLIEVEHSRNLAAISTAKLRLDECFRRYSERVPQYTDALNTLTEKARLAKTLVQDKTATGNETQQEAAKLFAEKVVPLDKLRSDAAGVVAQFQRDVEANRSLVLDSAGAGLDLPSASVPPAAGIDLLLADFTGQLGEFLGSEAEQSPTSSVNSLTKSVMIEETIRQKATAAIESHDTGPKKAAVIGTAVGVLAAAADYWLMQSRFETAQTRRCQAALDKIRNALWADPQNGLEASLTGYVELVHHTHQLALKRAAGGK